MYARLGTLVVALILAGSGITHAQSSTPVETLVGQQVPACNAGAQFSVTITSGLWWDAIQGVAPPARTMWLVVFFDATNLSGTNGSVGSTLKVRDEQGREFVAENPGGRMSNLIGDFYTMDGTNAPVISGSTMQTFALFAVAEDAQVLTLLADPSGCP